MPVIELTEENYPEYADQNLIIDFHAKWCGPCKRMAPDYEKVADFVETKGINLVFAKVDVDEQPGLAEEYDISAMPTLIIVKGGEPVGRQEGAMDADSLIRFINKHSNTGASESANSENSAPSQRLSN